MQELQSLFELHAIATDIYKINQNVMEKEFLLLILNKLLNEVNKMNMDVNNTLKYLAESDFDLDVEMFDYAVINIGLNDVEWIKQNEPEMFDKLLIHANEIIEDNDLYEMYEDGPEPLITELIDKWHGNSDGYAQWIDCYGNFITFDASKLNHFVKYLIGYDDNEANITNIMAINKCFIELLKHEQTEN